LFIHIDVREKMFQPQNVVITCSKSGKLTISLVYYWRDKVVAPNVPKKCLLLSDAWPGQSDEEIYKKVPECKRFAIPKKTTDRIQPLDVFYNRQMKSIMRHAYDRVVLDQLPISMSTRDNIIRLVSPTHSQMSAEIFRGLIRYAWHASGYVDSHPGVFKTVDEVCFDINTDSCQVTNCDQSSFIHCSWCNKILCFNQFFIEYHFD
jgi:hypothetical protein